MARDGCGLERAGSVESPGPPDPASLTEFEAAVVGVLLATGPGDVVAYGEVAAEAGYPGAARAVGGLLSRIDGLPWWRVVTASGRLTCHAREEQAWRLDAEGIVVEQGMVVGSRRP